MATGGGNTVVGNRVVWGAATVLARGTHPGADKRVSDGVAYAAALARGVRVVSAAVGRTGVGFGASPWSGAWFTPGPWTPVPTWARAVPRTTRCAMSVTMVSIDRRAGAVQ